MSEQDLTVVIFFIVFFAGILYFVFSKVRKHNHQSRSVWLSFLLVLAVVSAALFIPMILVSIVVSIFNPERNSLVSMGIAAAIVGSLIQAWRWSFDIIRSPILGESDKRH